MTKLKNDGGNIQNLGGRLRDLFRSNILLLRLDARHTNVHFMIWFYLTYMLYICTHNPFVCIEYFIIMKNVIGYIQIHTCISLKYTEDES